MKASWFLQMLCCTALSRRPTGQLGGPGPAHHGPVQYRPVGAPEFGLLDLAELMREKWYLLSQEIERER